MGRPFAILGRSYNSQPVLAKYKTASESQFLSIQNNKSSLEIF
jgi:hypothetical protein